MVFNKDRPMQDGCFATAYSALLLTSATLAGEAGDSRYLQGTFAGRFSGLGAT